MAILFHCQNVYLIVFLIIALVCPCCIWRRVPNNEAAHFSFVGVASLSSFLTWQQRRVGE